MGHLGWVLLVALSGIGNSPPPSAPAEDAGPGWDFRAPQVFIIPALETAAYDATGVSFDRFVLQASYAQISWSSVRANFKSGPRLDNDDIFVNFLGHPYQGAVPFNMARSLGLDFWHSVPYAIGEDLAWEFICETQAPSTNDLIESGVGGPLWGEAFYRITRLLLASEGSVPWPIREAATFVLSPPAVVHGAIAGHLPLSEFELSVPWHGRLYAGTLAFIADSFRAQVLIGADISYGVPESSEGGCVRPFDTFDIRADVGFNGTQTGDGFLRGIIAGCRLGPAAAPGMWGLFGLTDFDTGPGFRLAATSLGPGIVTQLFLGEHLRLKATAVAAGTAIAASGSTAETDWADPTDGVPWKPSRYSMGPGAEGVVDGAATWVGPRDSWVSSVSLRATGRSWWISAITPVEGLERVEFATLGLDVELPAWQFAGAEVSYQVRLPAQPDDPVLSGWTARLEWGLRMGTRPGL